MAPPAAQDARLLENLTRQHGVKVESRAGVEECCLAAGSVVGYKSILSASRMNSVVVIFLNTIEKANELIQTGIVLNDLFVPVLPLSSPSKKIVISNVPPFVPDDMITKALSPYGKIVSPIRKIHLGCKSPLVKHLVSFRRAVFMVLKQGQDELNLVLKFNIGGFDYTLFVSSDAEMKCFRCGQTGHLVRACPESVKGDGAWGAGRPGPVADERAVVVPPAAAAEPAVRDPAEPSLPAGDEPTAAETPKEALIAVGEPVSEARVEEEPATEEEQIMEEPVSASQAREVPAAVEPLSEVRAVVAPAPVGTTGVELGSTVMGEQEDQVRDGSAEVTPANAAVQAGVEVQMEEDIVFKVPNKRKKRGGGKGTKQAKTDPTVVAEAESESDGSLSDSGWSVCSQEESLSLKYTVDEIKKFLRVTKGQKGVRVEEHFPDYSQFAHDVKYFKREGAFTETEVFRLKKILTRINKLSTD